MPSCPLCGRNDTVSPIASDYGRYFCACNNLFSGSEREWRLWSRIRRLNAERRTMPVIKPPPRPTVKLTIPEMMELALHMPAYHAGGNGEVVAS